MSVLQGNRLVQATWLLAWLLPTVLVIMLGSNPHAAAASTMQLHGALHRDGEIAIVSHRGAAALAPENTLAAMHLAIEQGVDFIETDVQLTSDGVPVLMHDDTIDRTTSGRGPVQALSYAEVQRLDAGGWFGAEFAGERVPTLDEFFDMLEASNARALVELKGDWSVEQLAAVSGQVRSRYMVNRVALQSFDEATLRGLTEVAPDLARVMLTRAWNARTAELAKELEVSAVGGRLKLIDRDLALLDELRGYGIGTLTYTLNKPRTWQRAAERGIDLVVTDDPVRFAEWRAGRETGFET